MATSKIGHSHRRSDAQLIRGNRDHQTEEDTLTADAIVRACQRRAAGQIRRAKQQTRYRNYEFAAARRIDTDDRAGSGIGDRRGEVA